LTPFSRLNNLAGLLVFLIAGATYLLTREPTASWWDCGEFLSAAYKLEVVHEPGSPLFLLIGRLFSLFAANRRAVASMINASSALASAGTIMLLFWTITRITRRITTERIAVIGSGLTGALAYCFSDTFWFSAVESEVYALSSLCTALVVWAIFKWDDEAKLNKNASRFLVLIAFVMGLSIGVHLLNLLTIPAITFIVYFHFYKPTVKGVLLSFLVSLAVLAGVLYGIIPLTIAFAARTDVLMVNTFHWPFNLGALGFLSLVALALAALLFVSRRRKWVLIHNLSLALAFILVGYSSYAMVLIRAAADPPLNNSKPDNFISLLGYLGREQYQESPLLYGQYFTADLIKVSPGEMRYRKGTTAYETIGPKPEYVYDPAASTIFPRMWDSEHAADYRYWTGLNDKQEPSFFDNVNFFVSYQVDFMYLRYFLWNFAGRQNDSPSTVPNATKGNWLSGIPFIDIWHLGNQGQLPSRLAGNEAQNKLFFLPLLLGLFGLIFQIWKDRKGFLIILLLFLFTGLAVVVYLNMPPSQPRERDYAFSGSFYAFAIWIGLGVAGLCSLRSRESHLRTMIIVSCCLLLVPFLMACTEWKDHDRSTRFTTRDFAKNYLESCDPNAVLFSYGDNETYPLWYAQEVEGVRTDVRVINLSLFDASWCIDKARKKIGLSSPLPISWNSRDYVDGVRDYLYYHDGGLKSDAQLQDVLDFMRRDDAKGKNEDGENYLPTKNFSLKIDPREVLETGTVSESLRDSVAPYMTWNFNHNTISKGQIIILDILAHNHWRRPVYFCATMGSDSFMGMDAYLKQEGIVYRLEPLKQVDRKRVEFSMDELKTYHDLMDLYQWGNLNHGIHIDDQTNSFAGSFKEIFVALATKLYGENKKDSCLKVLNRLQAVIPDLPPLGNEISEEDFSDVHVAEMYFGLGETAKGSTLVRKQLLNVSEYLDFVWSRHGNGGDSNDREIVNDGNSLLAQMLTVAHSFKLPALSAAVEKEIALAGRRFTMYQVK